jgi:3-deoxy-manno-octulosonate cytidylyltransferase (CMP-KDO synthetase)
MSFVVLIPARLASTRLPGKPLADIAGVPMVVRVARRAALSAARRIVVAADHEDIVEACRSHGIEAVLTGADHLSGSDRLAEACRLLELDGDDRVLNVQGDEPLIDPTVVDACSALLDLRRDCVMATAAYRIESRAELDDPNLVKVVLDADSRALYFSRAPIPFWRDRQPANASELPPARPLRHVGLYAYRAGFLRGFSGLAPSPLEQIESLEQLRVLWHGQRIAVHVAEGAPAIGVDTPEDLARVRALFT